MAKHDTTSIAETHLGRAEANAVRPLRRRFFALIGAASASPALGMPGQADPFEAAWRRREELRLARDEAEGKSAAAADDVGLEDAFYEANEAFYEAAKAVSDMS